MTKYCLNEQITRTIKFVYIFWHFPIQKKNKKNYFQ